MANVQSALVQINNQMDVLIKMKQILEGGNMEEIIDLFSNKNEKGDRISHFLSDNRDLLRSMKDYFNDLVKDTPFSFEMNDMHLNNHRLTVKHETLGTAGEISFYHRSLSLYKNIFHRFLITQSDIEHLEKWIPENEERIKKYEREIEGYQKLSRPIKKLKGLTEEKFSKMEDFLNQEKEKLEKDKLNLIEAKERYAGLWDETMKIYFDYKQFVLLLEKMNFSHSFHAMEDKKTFFIYYRSDVNHSYSTGMTSYEKGHISILNNKEWNIEEDSAPNLNLFKFTEKEFSYLFEEMKKVEEFKETIRTNLQGNDVLLLENETSMFAICKTGFISIHGEGMQLHHLIRHTPIRNALFLTYKERTHEDFLNAIKGC